MAVYVCEVCGDFYDDDVDMGTEYGNDLICPFCVDGQMSAVDEELGEEVTQKMSEEEILEWARKNL